MDDHSLNYSIDFFKVDNPVNPNKNYKFYLLIETTNGDQEELRE